jgi:methylmalonyl-CoA mutase N-terminal domain/subunit
VDPAGGSYTIEKLTNGVQHAAEEYLAKIDAMGGMLAAIERGFVQREIQQAAYEYQKRVEDGSQVIVGVNRYQEGSKQRIPILRIDPEIERQQVKRLQNLRAQRDRAGAEAALRDVEAAARSDRNLMPAILQAAKACSTVGEISGALARVFGHHQEAVFI